VASVSVREALALEHVAEVSPAPSTLDLHPLSVRIGQPTHGARNFLVEGRPAAVGVELVFRAK